MRFLCLIILGSALSRVVAAPGQVSTMVNEYLALREVPPWTGSSTYDEATRVQDAFVDALVPKLGKPVGFKVGLVTKEAQERFNIPHPVRGRLLSKMLLPNDSTVPLQ